VRRDHHLGEGVLDEGGEAVSVRGLYDIYAEDASGNFGDDYKRITRLIVAGDPPMEGHVLEIEGRYAAGPRELYASAWHDAGLTAPRDLGRYRISAYGTPVRHLGVFEKYRAYVYERRGHILACVIATYRDDMGRPGAELSVHDLGPTGDRGGRR
jgi:hypothetical protein